MRNTEYKITVDKILETEYGTSTTPNVIEPIFVSGYSVLKLLETLSNLLSEKKEEDVHMENGGTPGVSTTKPVKLVSN